MKKLMLFAAVALAIAACGPVPEHEVELGNALIGAPSAMEFPQALDAAVDEQALGSALFGVAKDAAKGAAQEAVRESLPTSELAVIGAAVDERGLVNAVDQAVDGQAVLRAVEDAANEAAGQ